jgi:hypothetical protein
MSWLIAIISIILIIVFWRIFLPLALVGGVIVGLVILVIYVKDKNTTQKRIEQEQRAQDLIARRIASARANLDFTRKWEVISEKDPSTRRNGPRYAGILSETGLCRLQVEQRLTGEKLTAIYCFGLNTTSDSELYVKFDNKSTADKVELRKFSNGNDSFIPSQQLVYSGRLSYEQFLQGLVSAQKVALQLKIGGSPESWEVFSMLGSEDALNAIGAVRKKSEDIIAVPNEIKTENEEYVPNTQNPHLPTNARLNILGNDWECNRGFRQVGNECRQIILPTNAKLSILGNDWECIRGFHIAGSECVPVQIPVNGKLSILGNDWDCERGYRQRGAECIKIELPPNAKLSILGNDWDCQYGFRQVGESCIPVGVN